MHENTFDIFGLGRTEADAAVVLVPVAFRLTTSYGGGCEDGPRAIAAASPQLDFHDRRFGDVDERGIFMRPEDPEIRSLGLSNLDLAERARSAGDPGARDAVNAASERVFAFVRRQTGEILDAGRLPGVIGGEHAVAEGCIVEAAARHPGLGVLQIDAHMDLRASYEGFDRSHASVMHNVLRSEAVGSLVQVGMRDCCVEETRAARSDERVRVFFADDLADRGFRGESFASVASEIVSALPDDVWISFDIDGLEPSLCPGTGTPVPGGLSFAQASHLLHRLAVSGRRVVGFDLTEVAPSETGSDRDSIDAIVGARVLYRLCGAALLARERLTAPAG